MIQTWRLDCPDQTLVLAVRDSALAAIVYWGASLPDGENLQTIARAGELDVTGGMLDVNPALSVCPQASDSFPGQPGMTIRGEDGAPLMPKFSFERADEGQGALALHFRDVDLGLRYVAHFAIDAETRMISTRAELESDVVIRLDWLAAPVMPAPQLSDTMLDFSGRWVGEFQSNITPWSAGIRMRESRVGRSDHAHFPALIVPCRGASNTQGQAYAFHYGWSGGHRMIAEELPDGRRQVQFGHASGTQITPANRFETGTLYAVYSNTGLNGCAVGFQRHLRDRIVEWPDRDRSRPVHYNCWEAVYFDHDVTVLKDLATRAAALGAERFVLDDGWFGVRDDDTTSLGDWLLDARKYPDGLTPLIDHVQGLGMRFGIWFEPEMVNPHSDLYKAHPDWILGGSDQILGRQQMVLDMAQPQVCDYLFARIDTVLRNYQIDYIKWDHNRVLPYPDAVQTEGTYALIDRLRAAHPMTEIESCASGGGRVDFGILERTQRVWLSDSNDARERLRIQHNAALFLPMVVTGSHVGPRTCHTSGRVFDIRFRAWVAAARHMGFEMDPRELTSEEAEVLREVTSWWKANRDWRQDADILRLDSADPSVIAEQQQAADGGRFVVFAGLADTSAQIAPRPLRLTQLDGAQMYRITVLNRADAPTLSRGSPLLKQGSMEVSGAYLMQNGITLPWSFPDTMWVIEGVAI
ncbi:alpha-galactosidase [uncultured Sulfitobacter sp.]|uniref:alpha-galactosidase n=1 Tax=uncultured Sulfitobacter sp. TaxID=191468 RepID=UPI00261E47FA|nr:alpha-galactosidase [uncultured Sulfitobacter sp.]